MAAPARPTDPNSRTDFWDGVHDAKAVDGVSWWQSVPELSLALVDQAEVGRDDPIIDVGAGSSTLVDHLVDRQFRDLTSSTYTRTAPTRSGTTAPSTTSSPNPRNAPTTSAPRTVLTPRWTGDRGYLRAGRTNDL